MAFADEPKARVERGRVHFHHDGGEPGRGLDIAALLRESGDGTDVYYRGSAGFTTACAAATSHWPGGTVHCEHFETPVVERDADALTPGAFVAECAKSGIKVTGRAGTSLAGDVDHQDTILDDEERAEYLTACVSRAKGDLLVLDL